MQNQTKTNKKRPHTYSIKIVNCKDAACVSVMRSGHYYSTNRKHEPKGEVIHGFKDKEYNRGIILRKLGLWDSGQNLVQRKKHK